MVQDTFQVPPEMRALAEQSVEQAKKAFDGFMTATQKTVSNLETQTAAMQAGARDVTQKAVGFAEKNVAASFEFAQRLVRAKDAQEVMALQAEYMKNQMQALNEQARELGQTAATSAAKARPGG
jgi:phasin